MADKGKEIARRSLVGGAIGSVAGGLVGCGFGRLSDEQRPTTARPPIIIKLGSLRFLVRGDDPATFGDSDETQPPYFYRQRDTVTSAQVRRAYSEDPESFDTITFTYSDMNTLTLERTSEGLRIRSAWKLVREKGGRKLKLNSNLELTSATVAPSGNSLDLEDVIEIVRQTG